jgi:hypothetical protein
MDHPVRTLLYELFIEPILRLIQRVLDFVGRTTIPQRKISMPVLLDEPIGPVALPSDRGRPRP